VHSRDSTAEIQDPRPKAGKGILKKLAEPHPHQLEGLGSAVSSPAGLRVKHPVLMHFWMN